MAKLNQSTALRVAAMLIRAGVPFDFKRDTTGRCWITPSKPQHAAAVERAIELAQSAQATELAIAGGLLTQPVTVR